MKGMFRLALAASVSLISMQAMAGGFINSSQSTVFNGMAFAGAAAPGSTSAATMFMNPATMTGFRRLTVDTNYTFGVPTTRITTTSNNPGYNALFSGRSGDVGLDYFVPASYIIYPYSDQLYFGVSLNTTYGNSTKASTSIRAASSPRPRSCASSPRPRRWPTSSTRCGRSASACRSSTPRPARPRASPARRSPRFLVAWASRRLMAGASASPLA